MIRLIIIIIIKKVLFLYKQLNYNLYALFTGKFETVSSDRILYD